jgi:FkbH-like protein
MQVDVLKRLLAANDAAFWPALASAAKQDLRIDQKLVLSTLMRRGRAIPHPEYRTVRLALLSAYTTHPLRDLVELEGIAEGVFFDCFTGGFDDYEFQIHDPLSSYHAFAPEVTVIVPSEARVHYRGVLADRPEVVREAAEVHIRSLLELAASTNRSSGCEVVLANFPLPARRDPGPFRSRTLASPWTFRKLINMELGLRAPSFVTVLDLEYMTARRGLLEARDERHWFESKQPFSADIQVDIARETASIVASFTRPPAKVLAVDLDNTLWGGVVGDDGLEGIELGETSARGEAFRSFQRYLLELSRRGILLAVCSKNDHDVASEAVNNHPEMVLRMEDFAAFRANWDPKSENLRAIARDLNVGVDSIVFVDDNPAEIEIVRQFVPEVRAVCLGEDPASFVAKLQDSGFFEPRSLTSEDLRRSAQYREERQRAALLESVTDMDSYLASLDMRATISEFRAADVPRIAQLINKSNQFNLTTRRWSEAEVLKLCSDSTRRGFSVRLADRFGDYGLIAAVICAIVPSHDSRDLHVDTWVMSCRVLNRQMEDAIANELVRLATACDCRRIVGTYVPSPRNALVRDLYPRLGFALMCEVDAASTFVQDVPRPVAPTRIAVHHVED